MGMRPEGLVFWGFPLPVDEYGKRADTPWEQYNDEEFFAAKHGVVEPDKPYVKDDLDYSAYWRAKRALVEQSPCTIKQVGYDEFQRDIVLIKASYVEVEWSEVKAFPTEINPEWEGQLRQFCEVMEIKWTEPGWHVGARYG